MSKKPSKKSQPKSNPNVPTSQAQDMFQSLLDSPMYPSPTGSSSNPQQNIGFSSFSINPYSIPHYVSGQFQHPAQFTSFQPPIHPHIQTPTQTPINTPSEEVEETEENEEQEDVEEADPKGKRTKRVKVPWTDEETRILAECWVRATENGEIGNSQSKDSFWGHIRKKYNSLVTVQRRADQLTGKWSKMSKDIKLFIGIHSKIASHWESGCSDLDIMTHARKAFKTQFNRPFTLEDAWQVLKDCPKFLSFEGVMSNKRKTPIEIQDETINLEDDNPNQNPTQFESLFRQDPIRRPPGRANAKSQRSLGSSDAASRLSSEEARQSIVESANATKRAMDIIAKESETRTMLESLRLLSEPVSTQLPPDQYEMVMKARAKLQKKYAKKMLESSDDEE